MKMRYLLYSILFILASNILCMSSETENNKLLKVIEKNKNHMAISVMSGIIFAQLFVSSYTNVFASDDTDKKFRILGGFGVIGSASAFYSSYRQYENAKNSLTDNCVNFLLNNHATHVKTRTKDT